MNREMILRVADAIEATTKPEAAPNIGFNMGSFINVHARGDEDMTGHNCGTTACIAGWTLLVSDMTTTIIDVMTSDEISAGARELLGLDFGSAVRLFYADHDLLIEDIPPSEAVTVLRHLAETGKVDWSVAEDA